LEFTVETLQPDLPAIKEERMKNGEKEAGIREEKWGKGTFNLNPSTGSWGQIDPRPHKLFNIEKWF